MRRIVTIIGASALLGAANGGATTIHSGLYGHVTRGPTSPTCVAEQPCSEPAAGAALRFLRNGQLVAQTRVKADGSYRIALLPGTYTVAAPSRRPLDTSTSRSTQGSAEPLPSREAEVAGRRATCCRPRSLVRAFPRLRAAGFEVREVRIAPILNTAYDATTFSYNIATLIAAFVPGHGGISEDEATAQRPHRVGCANSVAPAKRSNLTSLPYARSVGPRLAIASESRP